MRRALAPSVVLVAAACSSGESVAAAVPETVATEEVVTRIVTNP